MTRKALASALVALFLSAPGMAAGPHKAPKQVRLSGLDQLALPGRLVKLCAKLEQEGFGKDEPQPPENEFAPQVWRRDIEGRTLHFYFQGAEVGAEVTNGNGLANLLWSPPGAGDHEIEVRFHGDDRYAPGEGSLLCSVRSSDRPFLVLDIDHTLSEASKWQVIKEDLDATHLPDSVEVVKQLSEIYEIVYVTARINKFQRYTRAWLRQHGFPRNPIFFLDLKLYPTYDEAKYKIATLHPLKAMFPGLSLGIGDKPSDAEAYRHHGLRSLILGETGGIAGAEHVESWQEIRQQLFAREIQHFQELHQPLE